MELFKKLIERMDNNLSLYAGYPPNTAFDYSALYPLLKYPLNNIGDPFLLRGPFSTHEYECELVKWFLNLYAKNSGGWGYVTTGSSEGVLFGMWNGKEKLKNPIVYYSDYAHYCIQKFTKLLGLEKRVIKSISNGEMDYADFELQLDQDRDAIVVATLGSTMTSSIDKVTNIVKALKTKNIKYYIHADAAIDGMILPFIKTQLTFRLDQGIDSISISGHKVIGAPIPCGIVLTKSNHILNPEEIGIIKDMDATILGSRNGFSVAMLWYAVKKTGIAGFEKFAQQCIKKAEFYCELFNKNQIKAWRFEHSITIVLEKLPEEIAKKWRVPSNQSFSTLTALPKLTDKMVQDLIEQIKYYRLNNSLPTDLPTLLYPEFNQDIALND